MSYEYLYQVVKCSRRNERFFKRELMVSERSAAVTNAEVIAEGYEEYLRARRNPNEQVFDINVPLDEFRYPGCPYCGSRQVFTCLPVRGGCGALSCIGRDENSHCCPWCSRATSVVRENSPVRVSESGFVDRPRLSAPAPRTTDIVLRRQEGGLLWCPESRIDRSTPEQTLDLVRRDPSWEQEPTRPPQVRRAGEEPRSRRLLASGHDEPHDDNPWDFFRRRK